MKKIVLGSTIAMAWCVAAPFAQQPAPTPKAAPAHAVGTSGRKASYELRAVSGVNAQGVNADALKAHLGKRVEVIVRPVESPAAAPTGGLVGVQAARPIEPAPERFSVTEIKGVIGTCGE